MSSVLRIEWNVLGCGGEFRVNAKVYDNAEMDQLITLRTRQYLTDKALTRLLAGETVKIWGSRGKDCLGWINVVSDNAKEQTVCYAIRDKLVSAVRAGKGKEYLDSVKCRIELMRALKSKHALEF